MKKVLITLSLSLATHISIAQPVTIGTTSNDELDFITNSIIRGRWLPDGPLLIRTTTPPASYPNSDVNYCAGVANGDWVLQGPQYAGNLYLKYDRELRSSPYDYGSAQHDNGNYAYINMYDGTNVFGLPSPYPGGYTFIEGFTFNSASQRPIVMQFNRGSSPGGHVLIGDWQDNGFDKVQINGSLKAQGYSAATNTQASPYTAAYDDFTILASANVTLPSAGNLDIGKIFVVKNIGGGAITVSGAPGDMIDGNPNITLFAPWGSAMVQWDGSAWYVLTSH